MKIIIILISIFYSLGCFSQKLEIINVQMESKVLLLTLSLTNDSQKKKFCRIPNEFVIVGSMEELSFSNYVLINDTIEYAVEKNEIAIWYSETFSADSCNSFFVKTITNFSLPLKVLKGDEIEFLVAFIDVVDIPKYVRFPIMFGDKKNIMDIDYIVVAVPPDKRSAK